MDLNDVFGVSSSPVSSYFPRTDVDGAFCSALGQGRHIVVYGASKQGKTALVSRFVDYRANVVVRLEPATKLEDIYSTILRGEGVELEISRREASGSSSSASVGIEAKATLWGFGGGAAKAEVGIQANRDTSRDVQSIPFNLSLAQDVVDLLRRVGFDKKVVLENFHYLSEEQQGRLAFALRSLEEMGVVFIILGVWRGRDRLRSYCGDLTDRLIEVPVEPWSDADFYAVAKKGASDMGVEVAPNVIGECVKSSFGSIGVFQELMKETFRSAGFTRSTSGGVIEDVEHARRAIAIKAGQYSAIHLRSLSAMASGHIDQSRSDGSIPLYLPYYFVRTILKAGRGFSRGLDRATLMAMIKEEHHRAADVRSGDITNLLNKLSSLQCKKGINPPIIDYDDGARVISAVDSTFFFFLKNCDLEQCLEELVSPVPLVANM